MVSRDNRVDGLEQETKDHDSLARGIHSASKKRDEAEEKEHAEPVAHGVVSSGKLGHHSGFACNHEGGCSHANGHQLYAAKFIE